jgi:hypothetical protein
MKNNILLFLFFTIITYSYSQNVVVDATTKQSISNVNILIKNTNKGFITDSNGVFYLNKNLKKGDTLVFSSLGYKKKEVIYKNKKQLEEVFLTKKIENLEEVILHSQSKEEELVQLGVIKRKKSYWNIIGKNCIIATKINSLKKRDDGIIKELIFKELKVAFRGSHNIGSFNKPKFINVKFKTKAAIKLQLYPIDSITQLPNIKKPLIKDNLLIVLNKNRKLLKLNISKYNIQMPKNGVFTTLEIIDVYNTNSKIEFLKQTHVLSYNISGNSDEGSSYIKWPDMYRWVKTSNAIFSLNVAYPVKNNRLKLKGVIRKNTKNPSLRY